MKAIVAADRSWGIGRAGKLLVSIPADMKMFRNETSGKVVVMGRKTLESFPNGSPLKNRTNIVLTRRDKEIPGCITVSGVEALLGEIQKYPPDEVYCIGGGQIYSLLLPYCDQVHVTRIDFSYEADTYFPNLDMDPAWDLVSESEEQTYFDLEYRFALYQRRGR